MKLRHIYITKEGEPMANPEMEYPGDINPSTSTVNDVNQFNKYHSGLLPFEDRKMIQNIVRKEAFEFFPSNGNPFGGGHRLKTDTLIPVDLEVEVVEQFCLYTDGSNQGYHRKVLRIKN